MQHGVSPLGADVVCDAACMHVRQVFGPSLGTLLTEMRGGCRRGSGSLNGGNECSCTALQPHCGRGVARC